MVVKNEMLFVESRVLVEEEASLKRLQHPAKHLLLLISWLPTFQSYSLVCPLLGDCIVVAVLSGGVGDCH